MTAPATMTLAARFDAAGLDWIVPHWPAHPAVRAFVTTRNGGVGAGPCASLDVGGHPLRGDDAHTAAIVENRRRIQAWLPSAPRWLDQVHGTRVVSIDGGAAEQPAEPIQADAAVTRRRGTVLAIRSADCLPVFLCDRDGEVVGAAHAGWRGLAAGLLENAVAAMGAAPARIAAWLGPAIGRTAFEVGDEVRDAFVSADRDAITAFAPGASGKWLADLEMLARQRLARAGVTTIHGGGMCTMSDPSRFFSYRRDRRTGRMAALIWIDPSAGRIGDAEREAA